MNKKCNKCSAEMSEVVKLGYFADLEKTNEYIDNFIIQLSICETCFEKDKAGYWTRYKHIIKEEKNQESITKNYLKMCGHTGDGCITNPLNLCWQYCNKIFPVKRCNNCDGLGELKTLQKYKVGKCKKRQESESKSVSEQSSTSPTDTQKQRLNKSWWACQPTGTKAVIIGGGVILGIILIGVGYYIVRNRKKNAE